MGEGYQAEFKVILPKKLSQLAEEVCGFANAAGGILVVGIDDDGNPIETVISNTQRSDIQNSIDNITPRLHCEFYPQTANGVNVFVIDVPSGENKPYVLNGVIYVRIGPSTKKLTTAEEMREFFQNADKIFFDETPCERFDIGKGISNETYDYFIGESGISSSTGQKQVFENLKLYDANGNFKNGAVLFFGSYPQHFFEKAITRCVAYDGEDKRYISDDKPFDGPLYKQYIDSLKWLKDKLNVRYDIEGQGSGPRKEIWEIPETVFREAIINALSHRDYYEKGATILIEVFDNRVEITNPGGLVGAIKPEQFGTKSFSRNPLIFGLFSRMRMVEQVGSGIQRMKDLIEDANLLDPEFHYDGMFSVTFRRPVDWNRKREKFLDILSGNQMKIMDLIDDNPTITKNALSAEVGISTTAIDNNIEKLRELGLLQRRGARKKGRWIIM